MKNMKYLRGKIADLSYSSMILAIAFLFVLLIGSLSSSAIGQEKKNDTELKETKESKLEIPATLPGIWVKVQENQKGLHEALAKRDLEHVHHMAFAVRDYATAMPGKSKDLTKEKQDVLAKSITRIGSLAKYLDEAGDKGDSTSVATYLGKLDKELTIIEALYPAQTLKAKEAKKATEPDAKSKNSGATGY
jgi:hypothetical protein